MTLHNPQPARQLLCIAAHLGRTARQHACADQGRRRRLVVDPPELFLRRIIPPSGELPSAQPRLPGTVPPTSRASIQGGPLGGMAIWRSWERNCSTPIKLCRKESEATPFLCLATDPRPRALKTGRHHGRMMRRIAARRAHIGMKFDHRMTPPLGLPTATLLHNGDKKTRLDRPTTSHCLRAVCWCSKGLKVTLFKMFAHPHTIFSTRHAAARPRSPRVPHSPGVRVVRRGQEMTELAAV